MLQHNNFKSVLATLAILIVAIGGYFTWSLLDDIDLAKYYDDSFQEMYGDLANFNDYQNKVHTTFSTTTYRLWQKCIMEKLLETKVLECLDR